MRTNLRPLIRVFNVYLSSPFININNKQMEKIRIQNTKTGKISEITKKAWDLLRSGGNAKIYDVIPMDKTVVKFNVPAIEEKPAESGTPATPAESEEGPAESETKKKRGPKGNAAKTEFVDIENPQSSNDEEGPAESEESAESNEPNQDSK